MTNLQSDAAPAPATSFSRLSVLLIDDDPFTHELLGSMLRQLGVTRIANAADGERGLATLRDGRAQPDVIVCDINMPGKDGFEVMEAMAAQHFQGSVILLSGMPERVLNSAALMARFHHLNVLGVVNKPVSKAALSGLLGKVAPK